MTNDRFRTEVVAALRSAATAHENGDFIAVSAAYVRLSDLVEELSAIDPDLQEAVDFMDSWYDSSSHDWQFYEPLGKSDWPRLGLSMADRIEKGSPVDESITALFTRARHHRSAGR